MFNLFVWHSLCNRVFMYFAFLSWGHALPRYCFVFLLPCHSLAQSPCLKDALSDKVSPLWAMPRCATKLPTGSNKVALLANHRECDCPEYVPSLSCAACRWDQIASPHPLRLQFLHWSCSRHRWVVSYPLAARLKSRIIFGRGYSQMGTFRWIALSHVLPHVCVLCPV